MPAEGMRLHRSTVSGEGGRDVAFAAGEGDANGAEKSTGTDDISHERPTTASGRAGAVPDAAAYRKGGVVGGTGGSGCGPLGRRCS